MSTQVKEGIQVSFSKVKKVSLYIYKIQNDFLRFHVTVHENLELLTILYKSQLKTLVLTENYLLFLME